VSAKEAELLYNILFRLRISNKLSKAVRCASGQTDDLKEGCQSTIPPQGTEEWKIYAYQMGCKKIVFAACECLQVTQICMCFTFQISVGVVLCNFNLLLSVLNLDLTEYHMSHKTVNLSHMVHKLPSLIKGSSDTIFIFYLIIDFISMYNIAMLRVFRLSFCLIIVTKNLWRCTGKKSLEALCELFYALVVEYRL
jgi:hypothetical protein